MSEEEQKHLQQSYYDLHEKYNKQKAEIERLNKIIEIKNNRIQQLMNRTRSARINKAIEYIEEDIKANYFKKYDDEVYNLCDELLEILKGSDK